MKLIVINVQRFHLPEFTVKELAIHGGNNNVHKTTKRSKELVEKLEMTKKQAGYYYCDPLQSNPIIGENQS